MTKTPTGHERITAWPDIITRAAELARVEEERFGVPPTLRRVHYLLVSDVLATSLNYVNRRYCYSGLSDRSTRGREDGTFPDLSDNTRSIDANLSFGGEQEARDWLARNFQLDRNALFGRSVLIASEKDGLMPLIRSRFGWMHTTTVRGFTSHTHLQSMSRGYDLILYVGDFDPSGLLISHQIDQRCSDTELVRVCLDADQVAEHGLVENPVKESDTRTTWMREHYGTAVQVELDALDPTVLLDLIATEVAEATGLEINADGSPVAPDLDAEEAAIRERLRG